MIKPVSVAVASLIIAGGVLSSQKDAAAETLDEALISAYQSNPTLQARRVYGRAVDEQVPQALSNWRPTVQIDGSVYHQENNTNPGRNVGSTPSQVGITLQQNIFRGLRTLAETDMAEESVKAERSNLRAVEQDTLLNAAQAYLIVLRDESVLDLRRNNERVLARQLEATQDRFNVGEVTRTDLEQSRARLEGAKADRIAAEGALKTSTANYEKVIGHEPRNLKKPSLFTRLPQTLTDAVETARRNNPSVIAAAHNWRGAQASVRDQQGKLLPVVTGQVGYAWNHDQTVRGYDNSTFRAGINVTVPLYQSGLVSSQIREAKHVAGQNRLLLDESRDSAIDQVKTAWENLQSAKASVESYKSQISANEIALSGVRQENMVGARTILDVLNADQELLNSKVNLVQADTNVGIYTYQLLAALGGMTAEGLQLNTPVHNPNVHYESVRYQWFGNSDQSNYDGDLGRDVDANENVSSRAKIIESSK